MKSILIACCAACLATNDLSAQTKPLFTENFESGQLDPKIWDQRVDGVATLKIQQDQVAHGKYALQIHYTDMAARSYAFIVAPHLPDAVKTHFFGRAYVKIDPATPPSHTVLLFAGGPDWPISKFEEIGVSRNTFQPSYQ